MYKVTVPVRCETAYEHKERTLAELRRCGAQRVAIAMQRDLNHRFSSRDALGKLGGLIRYFEENGLETLVWVAQTLGHDRASQPLYDHGFTNIRRPDGEVIAAFCPLGEEFSNAVAAWMRAIAQCGAKLILLDDDFRMGDRFGCCCEHHMSRIRAELGEDIGHKELTEKMLYGGKNKYRDAYLRAQGDGLRLIAKKIRAAVDEVDCNIRIGACVTHSRWDNDGADPIEIGRILAGKTKPFLRAFGAPYHYDYTFLANSVEMERTQLNWCKGEGFEVITEGDTYPRPRFACPASYLECFDMMLRADGGSDGIMRYMLDYVSSPDYETGYADLYEKNSELYGMIEKLFNDGKCVGLRPYLPLRKLACANIERDGRNSYDTLCDLPFEYNSAYSLITSNSLPASYEDDSVNIVFGESARHISDDEMRNGSIIDIEAAKILIERGIDVGLESVSSDALFIQDDFYALPKEYFPDANEYVRLDPLPMQSFKTKDTVKVMSRLISGNKTVDFVYRYENENGQKFLVLPFSARDGRDKLGYFKNYHRKEQLVQGIQWLRARPLEAHIESRHPLLYMLAKQTDNALCVGIWNLFQDIAEQVRVRVNVDFCNVEFTNCRGRIEENCIIIDSCIYPYEFAGFKLSR